MTATIPSGVPGWRKRPVVLKAVQFVDDDECDWDEIAAWCGGRIYNVEYAPGAEPETRIDIPTLEGVHTAMEGDWIVQGSAGEFWRVERDRFPDYYEPAGVAL